MRRATRAVAHVALCGYISIHALLAESDAILPGVILPLQDFYPRSPCGERQPSGGTPGRDPGISIHALLAESDKSCGIHMNRQMYFYPRSPCGERPRRSPSPAACGHFYPRSPCGERRRMPLLYAACQSFLSTLSLRRATMYGIAQTNTFKFLSTLSLRRATNCKYAAYVRYGISIHALLAESDQRGYEGEYAEPSISIHALLAESDALRLKMPRLPSNFYPRSPCGERLGGCVVGNWRLAIFLSTLSLRRATSARR